MGPDQQEPSGQAKFRTRDRVRQNTQDSAGHKQNTGDSAAKGSSQDRISEETLRKFREAVEQMQRNEREPWRRWDPNDPGDFANWPFLLIRFLFRHPSVLRFLVSAGMVVWSLNLIFAASLPASWLQAACEAGLFAVGLAGVAWTLLPGKVSFKKAGITAGGALALFLALLFWLKSDGHDHHDVSSIGLPIDRPSYVAYTTTHYARGEVIAVAHASI